MPTDDAEEIGLRRQAFVEARRNASRERYDAVLTSPDDLEWGIISPTHGRSIDRLLGLTRAGGTVLDAACGTGKYWSRILESGRTVIGTDQLEGVLEDARSKHPDVPTGRVSLQDLSFDAVFDAVVCIDALENIVPEDWPSVAQALAAAARPGAPLYLTVELADPVKLEHAYEQARVAGHAVVSGERFDGAGYHYYPPRTSVLEWLTGSGLEVIDETDGDGYWHLLVRGVATSA